MKHVLPRLLRPRRPISPASSHFTPPRTPVDGSSACQRLRAEVASSASKQGVNKMLDNCESGWRDTRGVA